MTPDVSTRRALAVAAVLVAALVALPRFLTHAPYQRLGAYVHDGRVERVVGPPAQGLLQPNDRLLALDGTDLSQPSVGDSLRVHGWPRGPLTLTVRRAGATLQLAVPPVHLSAWQRLRIYLYPIAAVIAAPIVAFLLVWRRPDLPTAWIFLWFAALQGLGVMYGLYQFPQSDPSPAFRFYLKVYEALSWLYPASFVHFMAVFPRARWTNEGRWRNPWFLLTVGAYLVPVAIWLRAGGLHSSPPELAYDTYQAFALAVGIFSLVQHYARSGPGWNPTAHERALAMLAAFAMLTSAALNLLASDPRLQALLPSSSLRYVFSSILIAWLSAPFVFAYLIAGDPLFDPRRLIVGGLPYFLISGVLAAIYLVVVLGGQRLFALVTGEQTMVFSLLAALVLAFAFAPLRERVQRAIDRVYGRDPEALRRALDAAGRDLLSALDRGEVRAAVEEGIGRGLRRPLPILWPEDGPPRLAEPEAAPEHARADVETLLRQAGIRLDNLRLAAERAAAERHAVELREAATRAELRALQAQVQPHFLFNALNALAYLTETDPRAAQRFTERLADMLRYTVEAGKRPAALLSEEIAFVEDYLGVARERYENPLEFRYQGDPTLLSMPVPPLLLQPLVENSLKHGLPDPADALHMTLSARLADLRLELEFADDGRPHANGGPGLGVGLENLEQRVHRFAGDDARVTAGPRGEGGYVVRMSWPRPEGGAR
ncbi:MAG TPA: histidine kinase [Candidatus Acidoferrales bacterium]|nr:histidine kinase [Candidatus Acidoferrales bacterium]